jgi:hypothetical protein
MNTTFLSVGAVSSSLNQAWYSASCCIVDENYQVVLASEGQDTVQCSFAITLGSTPQSLRAEAISQLLGNYPAGTETGEVIYWLPFDGPGLP